MTPKQIAAALGQLGGRARAARLSSDRKRQIAALGAAARGESLLAARRIAVNFRYAAAVRELGGVRPRVRRTSTCRHRLPGIYPANR